MNVRSMFSTAVLVSAGHVTAAAKGICRSAWRLGDLLFRNRVAIGLASLAWLILRSGSQPRRMTYPCQRAAAANVGGWAVALVPSAFIRRRHPHACPAPTSFARRALVLGKTLFVASALFLVTLVGVRAYDYGVSAYEAATTFGPVNLDTPQETTVAIVKDPVLPTTDTDVDTMVRDAVNKAGGLAGLVNGKRVVIKPNFVVSDVASGTGIVTDVRVVKTVVAMCWEGGASSIRIAEGTASWGGAAPSGDTAKRLVTHHAFKDAGYAATDTSTSFLYDANVGLVDLNDSGGIDQYDPSKVTAITLPNGVIRTTYYVPNVLLRQDQLPAAYQSMACDVLITVPTFKNHGQAGITLALKNRVGCAPSDIYYDRQYGLRPNMKRELLHTLTWPRNVSGDVPPATSNENLIVRYTQVDLNLVRPQDFVVVDGLVGITNGPTGTTQCSPKLGLIMAGRDSVAIDTVGTLVAQYDPEQLQQLYWADRRSLGTKNTAYITVVGSHVAQVKYAFPNNYGGSYPLPDKTSPTMTGLSPAEGASVWGVVPITGSGVTDNVGVVKAELEVDGQPQPVNRVAPYASFQWDASSASLGQHTLKVTVYDAALNEASLTRHVNVVSAPPQPDFSADVTSGVVPLTVQFTDQTTGVATSWSWDFGDGQTSTQQNPAHTYTTFGGFTVRLTVTGTGGSYVAEKADYITVTPQPPHAGFSADVTSGFAPLAVQFTDESTGAVTSWSWDFDDGATSTEQSPAHTYTAYGTHTVTLTVAGPTGLNDALVQTAFVDVRHVPGDSDDDGDVDLTDFSQFQACFNGPNRPPAQSGCERADMDGDNDVDLTDFASFQSCFNGPNRPPACQ